MSDKPQRVIATSEALDLIARLVREHGRILFHQSGGCCDGSSPMCFKEEEYLLSPDDVQLGSIGGVPFYMSPSQFEYWKNTQLNIDVVPGMGGMFSLENGSGTRFLTRSRIFSEAEIETLSKDEAAAISS